VRRAVTVQITLANPLDVAATFQVTANPCKPLTLNPKL